MAGDPARPNIPVSILPRLRPLPPALSSTDAPASARLEETQRMWPWSVPMQAQPGSCRTQEGVPRRWKCEESGRLCTAPRAASARLRGWRCRSAGTVTRCSRPSAVRAASCVPCATSRQETCPSSGAENWSAARPCSPSPPRERAWSLSVAGDSSSSCQTSVAEPRECCPARLAPAAGPLARASGRDADPPASGTRTTGTVPMACGVRRGTSRARHAPLIARCLN